MAYGKALARHFWHTYLSIDPRTLGLFRICFGGMLLYDLWLRYQVVEHFYSNEGILPNHTMLWAPPARRMFSLFFTLSTPTEATIGMAVCALVFVVYIFGYRTKLFQILAFVCLVSLNTRVAVLENGGDMVMNILCTFSMFLPLGARFSLDSLFASLRGREEHTEAELADRAALRPSIARITSVMVLALTLQLFFIYVFNVAHKTGDTWENGTAVHLTLHQDRLITAFGVWLRENAPVKVLELLTFSTLVVETVGAALIISPIFPAYTRALAILMMPMLHIGFAACLDLGPFSYAMGLFFVLLVHEKHWELGLRLMQRRAKRLVWFDADCGVCFFIARVLARMDLLERLDLRSNAGELPAGVDRELVQRTLVVQNTSTGRTYTRAAACAEVLSALPFCGLLALVMRVPPFAQILGYLYDRFAERRQAISVRLGLRACGLPRDPGAVAMVAPPTGSVVARRGTLIFREALGAYIMIACAVELLNANAAVPRALRVKQPDELRAVIDYVRLYQGWRMFAPEAPPQDFAIAIEATTIDKRMVDPYNEVASRFKNGPFTSIPSRLANDQYFTTYSLFIPEGRFRPYLTAFEQWILRYHERTGNPRDRITRFVAYKLIDDSPKPGDTKPKNFRRTVFMRFPK